MAAAGDDIDAGMEDLSMEEGGKKKIQKFGTQADVARNIYVFRNGDKAHAGERITLGARFRTMDQLYQHMNTTVRLVTGAVRKVVTVGGKLVRSLDDFEDGQYYVACGAEPLKRVDYKVPEESANAYVDPVGAGDVVRRDKPAAAAPADDGGAYEEEEGAPAPASKKTPTGKKSAGSPTRKAVVAPGLGKQKFGTQADVAKAIFVFRNGDKHHSGEKITLSKKFRSLDQLKDECTSRVRLVTGAVRYIRTMEGRAVASLDDLENGACYVACGAEPLKNVDYQIPDGAGAAPADDGAGADE